MQKENKLSEMAELSESCDFARAVRIGRARRDMTALALSKKTGVTQSTITNLGINVPNLRTINKLAKGLNMRVSELLALGEGEL